MRKARDTSMARFSTSPYPGYGAYPAQAVLHARSQQRKRDDEHNSSPADASDSTCVQPGGFDISKRLRSSFAPVVELTSHSPGRYRSMVLSDVHSVSRPNNVIRTRRMDPKGPYRVTETVAETFTFSNEMTCTAESPSSYSASLVLNLGGSLPNAVPAERFTLLRPIRETSNEQQKPFTDGSTCTASSSSSEPASTMQVLGESFGSTSNRGSAGVFGKKNQRD